MQRYLLILLFLLSLCANAQDYRRGVPFITSFGDKEFKVSNQIWDIVQDEKGIIYCANNDGILEFDGSNWTIIQTQPNRSITRTLAFGADKKLYSGAQDYFGYLNYNKTEGLNIKSLANLLPDNQINFGNIWKIFPLENKIVFYSWNALFIYENKTLKIVKTNEPYKTAFKAGNRIFVTGIKGLMELQDDSLKVLPYSSVFAGMELSFILPFSDNKLLVGTLFNGLFLIENNNVKQFLIDNNKNIFNSKLQCGTLLKNGLYVAGTTENGLFLFDNKGNLLQHISKLNGLSHNHVRQIFEDKDGNWWVLNEKGIDVIEASSPFFRIALDSENPSSIYSICVYNNFVYAASPTGLFYSKWNENSSNILQPDRYTKIYSAGEICWKLDTINGKLFLFSGNGLYEINGNKASLIYGGTGTWTAVKLSKNPDILIVGTYEGLVIFSIKNNKLLFKNKLIGFNETSRLIEEDNDGNIWVSHGYKGVYKITLEDNFEKIKNVKFYDIKKGFPSNLFINVFKVNKEIVFGTQQGVYVYDRLKDSMILHPFYSKYLGKQNLVRYLHEDKSGCIWYVMGDYTGVLSKNTDGSYSVLKVPFQRLTGEFFPGFENIWSFDNGNALLGTKNGIIFYNKNMPFQPKFDFLSIISRVSFSKDLNTIFYDDRTKFFSDSNGIERGSLIYKYNSLRFDYTACFYENIDQTRFSCYLEGHDESWSDWSNARIKEFTNLKEGNYVFHVKAKNVFEEESKEAIFRFTILPPYYRTIYAYLFYILLGLVTVWIIFKIRNRHFEREKIKFIEEQERQRSLEQVRFHEEKLMMDIEVKNKELAASAMKVIYKNEKMLELKKLIEALSHENSENYSRKISSILQFIEKELKDDQWDDFELRFDQANNNFIKRLKLAYPDLSSWDLKVCAYLKMNLSTKEIAQILNMSVRGVETARFRIRKRIGLEQADSLSDFILRF